MSEQHGISAFTDTANKGMAIEALPESPCKRIRIGDELQPVGSYARINPFYRTVQDIEAVQQHEQDDPGFKDRDWWWNHQHIGFLNGKLGLKALIFVFPLIWVLVIFVGGLGLLGLAIIRFAEYLDLSGLTVALLVLVLAPAWMLFALWIIPPTTNWLMSTGIGFFLKPFEKSINRKLDNTFEDGYSEFNRLTGQIRIALGRGRFFEAPFVEFDAYVERVVQQGGIFYRLMLVHRYSQKTFNKTSLSNIEAEKSEVLALWDMVQRYMDVTEPLPDVPRLEPFRHLDSVTRAYDEKTGRNPRFWRDLDLDSWKGNEGEAMLKKQRQYSWGTRQCRLTPQLGKVTLEAYRGMRPDGAWPI